MSRRWKSDDIGLLPTTIRSPNWPWLHEPICAIFRATPPSEVVKIGLVGRSSQSNLVTSTFDFVLLSTFQCNIVFGLLSAFANSKLQGVPLGNHCKRVHSYEGGNTPFSSSLATLYYIKYSDDYIKVRRQILVLCSSHGRCIYWYKF